MCILSAKCRKRVANGPDRMKINEEGAISHPGAHQMQMVDIRITYTYIFYMQYNCIAISILR